LLHMIQASGPARPTRPPRPGLRDLRRMRRSARGGRLHEGVPGSLVGGSAVDPKERPVTHRVSREGPSGLAFEPYRIPTAARGAWRRLPTAVRARLLAARLDASLAWGADPCDSAVLAHRAASLTSRRSRDRLAASIDNILAAAARPPSLQSVAIDPCRSEVAAAKELLGLTGELLRSAAPVYAQGVAILACLLRDGGGALYAPTWPGALRQELDFITAALHGADPLGAGIGTGRLA
jgi:hypothetical protein